MKLSSGKFWKDLLQMSVKAVLTSSLMSGRMTAKPGFHVALMMRSNTLSGQHKYIDFIARKLESTVSIA